MVNTSIISATSIEALPFVPANDEATALFGVFTGTYSSIFVAAPVLVDMDRSGSLKVERDDEAHIEELKKLA